MSECPQGLLYTKSHEWMREESDGVYTVGITDHAQGLLGDLVFVELPEANRQMAAGEEAAVVESVKTAADVYSPVAGEVLEVNDTLAGEPGAVNQDPYGKGWLFRMKVADAEALEALMDASGYQQAIEE